MPAGNALTVARPTTPEEAAAVVRDAGEHATALRVRGGGTKLDWQPAGEPIALELDTTALNRVVAYDPGDLTAVVQAGVTLAELQALVAGDGLALALDPPPRAGATIGGVLAAADSGPLRHRYGGPRDLVLGATVGLSDGTLARSGGTVIKNVAGYDLAKLLCGSHGTLGALVQVALRLHPAPSATATAVAATSDPTALVAAAARAARAPLEAEALDVAWHDGAGELLVRFGGAAAAQRARAAIDLLGAPEIDTRVEEDGDPRWAAQRASQMGAAVVLRLSARPSDLVRLIAATEAAGGRLVARAALGLAWVALDGERLVERALAVRDALPGRACVPLDGAPLLGGAIDPWATVDPGGLALMRRVKARFDPARVFAPGRGPGGE